MAINLSNLSNVPKPKLLSQIEPHRIGKQVWEYQIFSSSDSPPHRKRFTAMEVDDSIALFIQRRNSHPEGDIEAIFCGHFTVKTGEEDILNAVEPFIQKKGFYYRFFSLNGHWNENSSKVIEKIQQVCKISHSEIDHYLHLNKGTDYRYINVTLDLSGKFYYSQTNGLSMTPSTLELPKLEEKRQQELDLRIEIEDGLDMISVVFEDGSASNTNVAAIEISESIALFVVQYFRNGPIETIFCKHMHEETERTEIKDHLYRFLASSGHQEGKTYRIYVLNASLAGNSITTVTEITEVAKELFGESFTPGRDILFHLHLNGSKGNHLVNAYLNRQGEFFYSKY